MPAASGSMPMYKNWAPDRFLRAIDGIATSLGLSDRGLDADVLLASALHRSGRHAFRDESFFPALQLLLRCYEEEAELNIFGQHAAKWDVLRCLSNVLRFEAEEERDHQILQEEIEQPVFITGLPRSGTTLLHELFAFDPQVRAPRCWETVTPYSDRAAESRRKSFDRQLRVFQHLAPEMSEMHPLSADAPQECTEINAQVFQSVRYEATHRVPSYQKWLDRAGHMAAYRFHKRFLQHLQHQQSARPRWVLKCPDHIHALDAIEKVYPDCRFIFVHRDPLRVIASASKLTEVLRRPFARRVDKAEIGAQVAGRVIEVAEAMVAKTQESPAERILHIHYDEFARDPLAHIDRVYTQLGLEITPATRTQMARSLASPRNVNHNYSFDEFGLDAARLRDCLEPYMHFFKVHRESEIWKKQAHALIAA
jgi:hypothetical protein